jgi:hypothetical protein
MRFRASEWARLVAGPLAGLILCAGAAALAAESSFPEDTTLLMEVKPMKGSKRVPVLQIDTKSKATFDLWCTRVPAQFVVLGDTVTILLGTPTRQQCDAERADADEDLLASLQAVSTWSRQGDVVVFEGERPLRFRIATN